MQKFTKHLLINISKPSIPISSLEYMFLQQITFILCLKKTFTFNLEHLNEYSSFLIKNPQIQTMIKVDPNTISTKKSHVAVGGTFDHLHLGHQLLLLYSIMCTKKQLFIGVTSQSMLNKKQKKQLIQPVEIRMKKVEEFIKTINPDLKINIEEIKDPFGPTINQNNIQMIVVSKETIKGAHRINQIRKQKNLQILEVEVCPLIESEQKISSSHIRAHLLQKNQMTEDCYLEYRQKWKNTVNQLKLLGNEISARKEEQWWIKIFSQYSQNWRFYHTNKHIYNMLKNLEQYKEKSQNIFSQLSQVEKIVVQIGIWFHDIIYQPYKNNNEEQSWVMASTFLKDIGNSDQNLNNLVKDSIISTIKHCPNSKIQYLICGLDLAILDASHEAYQKYSQEIRKQYEPFVGAQYKQKRINFLKTINHQSIPRLNPKLNSVNNIKWQIDILQLE